MDAVHQRRWSRLNDFKKLFGILRTKNKSPGTDYTGTVTKVEGSTAYVQLTGSEITDTPVALSIDAKPGDRVRVRVSNGRAWITGNDTLPPSNDKKEVATKMSKDMSNRNKHIVIRDGVIKFIGDTLVVESKNFQLDEVGNATFSGTLNAAGGSFAGDVQVTWKRGDDLRQQVVAIGVDSKDAPIQINWPVSNGGYTQIMGGKIRVGYTTTGAYCDLHKSIRYEFRVAEYDVDRRFQLSEQCHKSGRDRECRFPSSQLHCVEHVRAVRDDPDRVPSERCRVCSRSDLCKRIMDSDIFLNIHERRGKHRL